MRSPSLTTRLLYPVNTENVDMTDEAISINNCLYPDINVCGASYESRLEIKKIWFRRSNVVFAVFGRNFGTRNWVIYFFGENSSKFHFQSRNSFKFIRCVWVVICLFLHCTYRTAVQIFTTKGGKSVNHRDSQAPLWVLKGHWHTVSVTMMKMIKHISNFTEKPVYVVVCR